MTLIVEDGSGKSNAESYISAADAATYLVSRGDATFNVASTTAKENALRNATDYMVQTYRYLWAGYRFGIIQNLDWPRSYVPILDVAFGYGPAPQYIAFDSVPIPVQQACADLALRSLSGDLAPDVAREDTITMAKVGPIEVQYNTNMPVVTIYRAIAGKLRPFLIGQGGMTKVIRT